MRFVKLLGILAGLALAVVCFLPWITLEERGILVTGMDPSVTNYGKPGMLHLIFTGISVALLLVPRVWSRRLNLLFGAFNTAWAFRNFFLISACYAGECPERQPGLYLLPLLALLLLGVILFAPEKRPRNPARDALAD